MLRRIAPVLLLLATAAAPGPWVERHNADGIIVESRDLPGSPIVELRMHGVIDAPPERVLAVLDDVDAYPDTMPYMPVSRAVTREGRTLWQYCVAAPPIVSRRDYCVRIEMQKLEPAGYRTSWTIDDARCPQTSDGYVRVPQNDGTWTLVPLDGGTKTEATQVVRYDPGGAIPKWLVNAFGPGTIADLFKAVRAAAVSSRYATAPNPWEAHAPPPAEPAPTAPPAHP